MTKMWANSTALYQIYPRSFMDSNGDGVGDIPGIIEKLPYLQGLGVDAIWLSPVYASPQVDCGYDVSDYRTIDPLFGTLADMDALIAATHKSGLKIVMDFVANHTSNQHEWFKQASTDRHSPYRDYYVWRDAKLDGSEPTNWISLAGGKSWTWSESAGQYYLHSFMPEQPDLNWDNPKVRQEMCDILRFWLDRGVDGFRIDAAWPIAKSYEDEVVLDAKHPADYGSYVHDKCKNGPKMIAYMKEMAQVMTEYTDAFMIFEYYTDEHNKDEVGEYQELSYINPLVSAPFVFDMFRLPWHASARAKRMAELYQRIAPGVRISHALGNHDQTRIVSRFGESQARALAVAQLTLPGMPTIYNGEEIGMSDYAVPKSARQDNFQAGGGMGGRDPERTPMQWSDEAHAGFSTQQPWLPVNVDYKTVNVAQQQHEPESMLALYRQLLQIRRNNKVFRDGTYSPVDPKNGYVWAYQVSNGDESMSVYVNFADQPQKIASPAGQLLVSSVFAVESHSIEANYTLAPYEAVVIQKEKL